MENNTVWNWMHENEKPDLDDVITTLRIVDEQPLEFDFSYEDAYNKALDWYKDTVLETNLGALKLFEYLKS